MKLEQVVITLIIILLPLVIVASFLVYNKKRIQRRRKNPLTSDLLRGPGQSLIAKIEEINLDIDSYLMVLLTAPMICFIMYLQSSKSFFTLVALSIVVITFTLFSGFKMVRLVKKRNQYTLGLDAELMVGQELNHLMRDGYYVFHDFPADNYNIDHVVVGSTGVFAVETKARSKQINDNGKSAVKVKFDGGKLYFPSWTEVKPIEQSRRQAESLQKWLTSAVGDVVRVKPVLAVPGWYVDRVGKSDVAVINGKESASYFNANRNYPLDEKMVKRVAHQLEQKCRDVKPKAYKAAEQ